MAGIVRATVSTVAQTQGPNAASHDVVVSRELVPFQREHLTPDTFDDPKSFAELLHRMQENVDRATQSARSLPVLGGVYCPDLVFTAATPRTIPHRCQGRVAMLVASLRPSNTASVMQIYESSQDSANNRITVVATANCTADLWFFPKPAASR